MMNLKKGTVKLIIIYISIVATISIKIYSDPAHYTTPDSIAYLSEAENILSNKSLSIFGYPETLPSESRAFTIWPIGYPILIASVSWITNTSVLFASKLVNFIFIALLFLLFAVWFGKNAWVPALYFYSYSMLEIFSHTWSDGPFLFFVVLLCYLLNKIFIGESRPLLFTSIFACLVCLFLLRYAGVLYFLLVGVILLHSLYKKQYKKATYYFLTLSLSTTFVVLYFYNNQLVTGYYFGSDRSAIPDESVLNLLLEITLGSFNELTIARNYYFQGHIDYLYVFLSLIQGLTIYILVKNSWYVSKPLLDWDKINILFYSAASYFVGLISLRFFQIITEFNYRILAPASVLIYVLLLISIAGEHQMTYFRKVRPWIVGFMILSLLMNLPKAYLLTKFSEIL